MLTQGVLTAAYVAQVCAYANNQWDLSGEIQEDLRQTSFYRAMVLAKVLTFTVLTSLPSRRWWWCWCCAQGTVSIIDERGVCFTRIWCCPSPPPSVCCACFTGCVWGVV